MSGPVSFSLVVTKRSQGIMGGTCSSVLMTLCCVGSVGLAGGFSLKTLSGSPDAPLPHPRVRSGKETMFYSSGGPQELAHTKGAPQMSAG